MMNDAPSTRRAHAVSATLEQGEGDAKAERLTAEARAMAPRFGDSIRVTFYPGAHGGFSLWLGDAAWGLGDTAEEARPSMVRFIEENPAFTAPI
jgi:hypothetical protein